MTKWGSGMGHSKICCQINERLGTDQISHVISILSGSRPRRPLWLGEADMLVVSWFSPGPKMASFPHLPPPEASNPLPPLRNHPDAPAPYPRLVPAAVSPLSNQSP